MRYLNPSPRSLARLALLCSLTVAGGCDRILGLERDPKLADGPWRCLTDTGERWDAPRMPKKSTALVRVLACDLATDCAARINVDVKVCGRRDEDCNQPLDTEVTWVENELRFEALTGIDGFAGYLDFTSPTAPCTDEGVFGPEAGELCKWCPSGSAGDDPENPEAAQCELPLYLNQRYFISPPVIDDMEFPLRMFVLPLPAALAELEAAGVNYDRTKAIMVALARDCDGTPAAEVFFENEQESAVPLLQLGGVLTKPSDTLMATDASGAMVFVNVDPGSAVVHGFGPDGLEFGDAGISVKPFTVNVTPVFPNRFSPP